MIPRKYLVLAAMIGTLVSFDQLTKFMVMGRLRMGDSRVVIPDFLNLTVVHNTGAAFGLLADMNASWREPFFYLLPGITMMIILVFFARLKEWQTLSVNALALILGGAVGNLVDRLRLGYVVDFIDFHFKFRAHFPAFNVADTAITLGVALMILAIFVEKEPGVP